MIEVYKILSGKYDSDVAPVLITNDSVTRGNKYILLKHSFRHDIRKFSFTCRIVNIWNSLPNYVIDDHANTIDIFKTRLDKFWKDQDVYYDFTCELLESETDLSVSVY